MNGSSPNTLIGSLFAGTICLLLGAAFLLIGVSTRLVRAKRMQTGGDDEPINSKFRSGFVLCLISAFCYLVSYSTYLKADSTRPSLSLLELLGALSVSPNLIFLLSWIVSCAFAFISYLSIRQARWHHSQGNARILFSRDLSVNEKLVALGFEPGREGGQILVTFLPALLGLPIFIYLFQRFNDSFAIVVAPLLVLGPYFALTLWRYSHRPLSVYGITDSRILWLSNCFDAAAKVDVLSASAQTEAYLEAGRIDRLVSLAPIETPQEGVDPDLLQALKRARAKQAKEKSS
jgi:hypothetical protein